MKMKKVKTKYLNSFAIIFALSIQAIALEDSGEPKSSSQELLEIIQKF